ncbi:uncharacterized protein EI90DRAFT_3030908 [Cantharellus anzutake]|uniref:uncharacterized protein n=1 Tax=Cantharellus anzutake TaxID=1750568 RepID=UPI0019053F17|nr:uncharacterized protein EI90DRAFT_3030908 [Cantharellus anzutake]KAF8342972.1 hypothetical protein EI90DRAFT_3030908 [Cantharellus anzutake]
MIILAARQLLALAHTLLSNFVSPDSCYLFSSFLFFDLHLNAYAIQGASHFYVLAQPAKSDAHCSSKSGRRTPCIASDACVLSKRPVVRRTQVQGQPGGRVTFNAIQSERYHWRLPLITVGTSRLGFSYAARFLFRGDFASHPLQSIASALALDHLAAACTVISGY